MHHFRRVAGLLKVDPDWIEKEVRRLVRNALDTWPSLMVQLPLTGSQCDRLTGRWDGLDLVEEVVKGVSLDPGPANG